MYDTLLIQRKRMPCRKVQHFHGNANTPVGIVLSVSPNGLPTPDIQVGTSCASTLQVSVKRESMCHAIMRMHVRVH